LASQDSLPSFLEDDTGSLLSTSLPDTVLFQKLNERPSSEGNNLDDMVPALPQKMVLGSFIIKLSQVGLQPAIAMEGWEGESQTD